MILLKEFLEICDYKITGGSDFCWQCFGPNAYTFDAGIQDFGGDYSFQMTFDTKTQIPYCAEICDYKNNRAYRIFNPFYVAKYNQEVEERGVDDQAWDDVMWTTLDLDEDFVEKAKAIIAGEDYSTDVMIPLDMPKEELHALMLQAHNRNITLNQLVEDLLSAYVAENYKI